MIQLSNAEYAALVAERDQLLIDVVALRGETAHRWSEQLAELELAIRKKYGHEFKCIGGPVRYDLAESHPLLVKALWELKRLAGLDA